MYLTSHKYIPEKLFFNQIPNSRPGGVQYLIKPYGESLYNVKSHLLTLFFSVCSFISPGFLKKHIKIIDVKIKWKESSPSSQKTRLFRNRRERSHSVTLHEIAYFVSFLDRKFKLECQSSKGVCITCQQNNE